MIDIVITGVFGQLGSALLKETGVRNISATGRDMDTLDIRDGAAVQDFFDEVRPKTVVNCAAYTAVDDCESHEDDAMAINGAAVGVLAHCCDRIGAKLIHVSTDYVFDGSAQTPYRESDPIAPQSAYGRSKLEGEIAAAQHEKNLIVRTAWLYGLGGRNFVEAIRGQINKGVTSLRVVSDQIGTPTFAGDLASAILDLNDIDARGMIHAVNSGVTSWHGFASMIVEILGKKVDVIPVSTSEFPRPAPRPAYSVLDTQRLNTLLGHDQPSWHDALERYLDAT